MLKSLLFSLTLMLCLVCGSPLTQAAEDVSPEKPASAENQTSTEDRYKALLRRLDTIESNLKAKQHIDAALKEFDAKTQGQVSMLSTGFTALGAMTGILALAGLVIAVLTSKMYLQSLRGYRKELKEILDEARKHRKTLREMVAEHSPAEKFTAPVLAQAREATTQGVGTEVLRGKAILAQQAKRWQEALLYWQGVLETSPHDDTALFGASLAALRLSMKATGEERQRLWQTAENYFKAFPETQLTVAVLVNWGNLCAQRGIDTTNSKKRERWFNEAKDKYLKATKAEPNNANSWYNWGVLCASRGKAASDADTREHWYAEAEKKIARALAIAPHNAAIWFNKACLASLRQDVKACLDALEQWRKYAPAPSAAKLDNDTDFDNVRDTPEFQEFRKKLADNK
ncbi:hypothetical protein QUW15_04945 [Desulfovibrio piger]|nr:hypothetical protein [Desulfovibrio piger]